MQQQQQLFVSATAVHLNNSCSSHQQLFISTTAVHLQCDKPNNNNMLFGEFRATTALPTAFLFYNT